MKKLLHLILSFVAFSGYAQDYNLTTTPYVPSAQAYSMIRYGNTPVSYYTGTATLDIPIFEYKDADFTIPLSLGYAANSFMPQAPPSAYGLNWFLNVGGVITREVRGVPDDVIPTRSRIVRYFWKIPPYTGFLQRRKVPDSRDPYGLNDRGYNIGGFILFGYGVKNGGILMNYPDTVNLNYVIESEADVYHFNFMGYKGTFTIGGDLEPIVFNTDAPGEFKVDLTGMTVRDLANPTAKPNSSIVITTGDGYRYTFGGNMSFVEYTGGLDVSFSIANDWYITSWYLARIEAPNGNTVTFSYTSTGEFPFPFIDKKNGHVMLSNGYLHEIMPYREPITPVPGAENQWTDYIYQDPLTDNDWKSSYSGITYLKEVCVNGSPLYQFDYGIERDPLLRSITIAGRERKVELKHTKMNRGYPHLSQLKEYMQNIYLLDTITVPGQGVYKAAYHFSDMPLPVQDDPGFDHWGFWSGNGVSDYKSAGEVARYLSPGNIYQNAEGDQVTINPSGYVPPEYTDPSYGQNDTICSTIIDDSLLDNPHPDQNPQTFDEESINRVPGDQPYYYGIGLLKTMTYPTGGSTTFEYEQHSYVNRVQRTYNSGFAPRLDSCGLRRAGGARVKKITDDDGQGGKYSREFFYTQNDSWNKDLSSGNLLHWPRYYVELLVDYSADKYISRRGSNILANSFDKTHIEYSRVYERFDDGTFVEYNFSNYSDYPDGSDCGGLVMIFSPVTSNSIKRGRLLSKRLYDNNKNLVKEEEYSYNNFFDGRSKGSFRVRCFTGLPDELTIMHSFPYAVYTTNYKLNSVTTKDFMGGEVYETKKWMEFNELGQLAKTSVNTSDGSVHSDKNTYVKDLVGSQNPVHQKMIEKNVLGYPLQTVKMVDGMMIGGQVNEFQLVNNAFIKPHTIKSFNPPIPLPLIDPTYLNTEITFQKYDAKGHPLQVTDKGGITTSYIWGYDGLYVVAKVDNATIDKITAIPGLGGIETAPLSKNITSQQISSLYAISDAQVSVFDYKPLVGLIFSQDPSGRAVYYSYDRAGRLNAIRDSKGDLVERYSYHYRDSDDYEDIKPLYTITCTVSGNGKVGDIPLFGSNQFVDLAKEIAVFPDENHFFYEFKLDGKTIKTIDKISKDYVVEARFVKGCKVTCVAVGGGLINSKTEEYYRPDTTVDLYSEFQAKANEGYFFTGFYSGGQLITKIDKIDKDYAIEARFVKNYKVTITATGGGMVISKTEEYYRPDTTVDLYSEFQAKANEGYFFTGFYSGGQLITKIDKIDKDYAIEARFVKGFKVTCIVTIGGSVLKTEGCYRPGTTVNLYSEFRAEAAYEYFFVGYQLDRKPIDKINAIDRDYTIVVVFQSLESIGLHV